MAKGNLFQGMARGKVGDVVFSRLNGKQVSRVRNREPRNPRTNAQLVQRAIMATIMQAYSKGKAIFDHSFQGESVGMNNMRKFMKLNADKLRAAVAADINGSVDLDDQVGRVVAPRANQPVAFPYIISQGDYSQNVFDADGKWAAPASGVTTLGGYADQLGLIAGDYYTIVAFKVDYQNTPIFEIANLASVYSKQYPCEFGFVRLKVKDSIIGSTETVGQNPALTNLFDIDAIEGCDPMFTGVNPTSGILMENLWGDGTQYAGGYGIIRSRKDQDLRSDSVITIIKPESETELAPYGIVSQYALQGWKQGTQAVGDSDLILEGGGF